ncbi:MAG TPA: class I SAM-dependent methyltransferase [Anaerolineaceae bacterium]|nr:class I SAM-dependent methyltransferase [Anaerolineaceae bacterium]
MKNCCQCQGIEELFDQRMVNSELEAYRRKGPEKTTRMLVNAIKQGGIQGASLLDIGGGIGAIQHELLAAGVETAVDVDASRAYLAAARSEAGRRGLAGRISYQHGDFVKIAVQIPSADIVTLDRVICCYDDMERLVSLSAARARRLYGVVYPRDTWWTRLGLKVLNFFFRLRGSAFRTFVHPTKAVEALVRATGLQRRYYAESSVWQIAVFAREL